MPPLSIRCAAKAATSTLGLEMDEGFRMTIANIELYDLYLSYGGGQLSRKNLLTKLSDYFGPDFLVLSAKGVASLVVFRSKVSEMLRLVPKDGDDASLERLASQCL